MRTSTLPRMLLLPLVLPAAANTSSNPCSLGSRSGDGDDTAELQRVLDDPRCDELVLPAHRMFTASVLWVRRSNMVLTIETNTTLAGMPATFREQRPDCATEDGLEFNWRNWCALLRVESPRNFTLRGEGTIAPGGVGGTTPDFYSALHVTSTAGVSLTGVRVYCTAWWWCTALHNATSVHVAEGFFIDGARGRDGMDLVNCRDVVVEDSTIMGSDDGLCLKTIKNEGLAAYPSYNVTVRRMYLSSTWCNAIQFGSATEVDMFNFKFKDITIGTARKAAIGIISMDGANISAVSFDNVSILSPDVACPLFIKIGNRVDCEDHKGTCWRPGSIRDVNLTAVTAVGWGNVSHPKPGHGTSYTATIEGLNASYPVGPIRIDALKLAAPGGGTAADAEIDPPTSPLQYAPRHDGVRPSFGLFVRFADRVTMSGSSLSVAGGAADGRPAIVIDQVDDLVMSHVSASGGSPCQIEDRGSTGNWSDLKACRWTPSRTAAVARSPDEV